MNIIQSPRIIDYCHLLLLGAIWGSTFIAIDIAIENLNAIQVSLFRIFLAAIVLIPIAFYKKHPFPRDKKIWLYIALTAVLNNAIPFSLIAWGQQHINSSTAAIILACGPFTTLILGHLFTKDERITPMKFLGIVLGFLGVWILFSQELMSNNDLSFYGKISIFLASCCYVISGFLIKKMSHTSPLVCSSCMFMVSTCLLLPLVFSQPLPSLHSLGSSLYAIIFLALIPTAAASLLRVRLIQKVGMQFISQVSFIIPLFAIFWSLLIFNEVPKESTWHAFSLIFVGLLINKIQKKKFTKKFFFRKIIFLKVFFKEFKIPIM